MDYLVKTQRVRSLFCAFKLLESSFRKINTVYEEINKIKKGETSSVQRGRRRGDDWTVG